MKINSTNNINFNGNYRINLRHPTPNKEISAIKDGVIIYWSSQALNKNEVIDKLYEYLHPSKQELKEEKPFYIDIKIEDSLDYYFEDEMTSCAQSFEKLV